MSDTNPTLLYCNRQSQNPLRRFSRELTRSSQLAIPVPSPFASRPLPSFVAASFVSAGLQSGGPNHTAKRTITLSGDVQAKPHMPRENLLTLLADFERYGSDVAIVQRRGYRRESWTYAELLHHAAQFATELKSQNIRTGDRVLLWAPNSAQWLIAFWG